MQKICVITLVFLINYCSLHIHEILIALFINIILMRRDDNISLTKEKHKSKIYTRMHPLSIPIRYVFDILASRSPR